MLSTLRQIVEEIGHIPVLEEALQRLLEDRRKLASTLHDEIAQSLTLAVLSLKRLDASAPQQMALAALDEAASQVRDTTVGLRPSLLDQVGLLAAIRLYAESQLGRIIRTDGELDSQPWSLETRGRWYWACQQLLVLGDSVTEVVAETSGTLRFSPWKGSDAALGWLDGLGFKATVANETLSLQTRSDKR